MNIGIALFYSVSPFLVIRNRRWYSSINLINHVIKHETLCYVSTNDSVLVLLHSISIRIGWQITFESFLKSSVGLDIVRC